MARGRYRGEAGCPSAVPGEQQWSRYAPVAHREPHAAAGGCVLKEGAACEEDQKAVFDILHTVEEYVQMSKSW